MVAVAVVVVGRNDDNILRRWAERASLRDVHCAVKCPIHPIAEAQGMSGNEWPIHHPIAETQGKWMSVAVNFETMRVRMGAGHGE